MDKETYLVVGLGNPGAQYAHTRHNAGFEVTDILSARWSAPLNKKKLDGLLAEIPMGDARVVLCQPQTYMNLSGECVAQLLSWYKCPLENLLVIYDDIDLPVGALRIRASGSAGTHNGMRSVVACVGSENFPRIRIGVGEAQRGELKDFVLGKPGKAALQTLDEVYQRAADAAQLIIAGRIGDAQARYNKKHEGL